MKFFTVYEHVISFKLFETNHCIESCDFIQTEAVVQRCSVKKGFLEISLNSQAINFIKKETWRKCFPVNFEKFLITPFLTEHLRRLLLLNFKTSGGDKTFI